MTIAQAERFYGQDTKDYEIEKNKDFLIWHKNFNKRWLSLFYRNRRITRIN